MILCPKTSGSDVIAVVVTSAQFNTITAMAAGQLFLFCSTTNCYIAQAANPTASAADGSMFVPAGVIVTIDGAYGAKLAVIRSTADGTASLTPAGAPVRVV